jgi:hypothetical protein
MRNSSNKEFSKTLLVQESILIWIMTISFIALAFICIFKGYTGSLPWLSAMSSLPWGAYAVSQAFYYSKAKAENTAGGLKFETIMKDMTSSAEDLDDVIPDI